MSVVTPFFSGELHDSELHGLCQKTDKKVDFNLG